MKSTSNVSVAVAVILVLLALLIVASALIGSTHIGNAGFILLPIL